MQVGQLASFAVVGIRLRADLQQTGRLCRRQLLEPGVLGHRDGGDVGLDVRVGTVVDQRYLRGKSDELEFFSIYYSCIRVAIPFDCQAEPEDWLASKGAT